MKKRRVVELFAGVGGFRVGLNNVKFENEKVIESNDFDFVFFNQWEPSKKVQWAYECYSQRFDNGHKNTLNNTDIMKVDTKDIPEHDLLVGGFPCQDYSVARSLRGEMGIEGKKGVLWWEIYRILKDKRPNFLLLENVDRLLISPSKQRGRDFSIILWCLNDLGYYVEWKVINAADYGMPQKRKRVFIFASLMKTKYFKSIEPQINKNPFSFIQENKSFFTEIYNVKTSKNNILDIELPKDILEVSNNFTQRYYNTGFSFNNKVYTFKTESKYDNEKNVILGDLLLKDESLIDSELYINDSQKLEKFKYLKGHKRIKRERNGFTYFYSEGQMSFPEKLDAPGRTMLTSEGSVNRSTHVVTTNDKYRILSPIECERLNTFPDNWTKINGITNKIRYFLMGNALVCEIIQRLSSKLKGIIDIENEN